MQEKGEHKSLNKKIMIMFIVLLCVVTVVLDVIIAKHKESFYLRIGLKTFQQLCGAAVGVCALRYLGAKLFRKAYNWLYLLPCLIIAIDNFQFGAFFNGRLQLVRTNAIDFALFALNCMSVGLFEEIIFRGIVFSVLASRFTNDKRGFLKTYVVSSVVFGLAHLLNGFSMGTILQVGYTILTGGLFAFCLIKTKNILCCALVHGVYNFCGLLFDAQGLGNGIVFDTATVITMLIVSVVVGIFVLYKVWTYSDTERAVLYRHLGIED